MCRRSGAQALRTRKEETMTEGVMNLSAPRGEKNVWDQRPWQLNACDSERWLTAAMGSGLTVLGTRRGGFSGGMKPSSSRNSLISFTLAENCW